MVGRTPDALDDLDGRQRFLGSSPSGRDEAENPSVGGSGGVQKELAPHHSDTSMGSFYDRRSDAESERFIKQVPCGTDPSPSYGEDDSQVVLPTLLASRVSFAAEGKGFEPSTPCGAPHFECGC